MPGIVRKKVIATLSSGKVLRSPQLGLWKSWLADGMAIYPRSLVLENSRV